MRILDLGCNGKKLVQEGAEIIGVDIQEFDGVDVIHNLEETPLPFESSSFDVVRLHHVLEHIKNKIELIQDIYRVLKTGGILVITVPHRSNPLAHHVEHHHTYTSLSFDCMVDDKVINGFELVGRKITLVAPFRFLEPFAERFANFYDWRLTPFIPATQVEFELMKCATQE